MKNRKNKFAVLNFRHSWAKFYILTVIMILNLTVTNEVWACACGCGVFEVGTASMLPDGPGGMLYVDYDYQNQYENYSGSSRAPAANNDDKKIETSFINVGTQYFFNKDWGIQGELPYDDRSFTTTGGASGNDIVANNFSEIGDMRVQGIYTGFSPDMSTGLSFGTKLPTGEFNHNDPYGDIDRDSEIGTGSTDFLLGGFHRQVLVKGSKFTWFTQAEFDLPVFAQDGYRPGIELDASAGIYYGGWSLDNVRITPIAQIIGSERTSDSGPNSANPVATGYQRILLSPGLEVDVDPMTFYADVELPVYENVVGNQLIAPALFKVEAVYHF